MNEMLKEYIGNFFIVYLDDILIYNKTKEVHLKHLTMVLSKLQKEKLMINLKKCSFMKRELIYLGFVVYEEGLKMDPEKVKKILDCPTPRSVYEVVKFGNIDNHSPMRADMGHPKDSQGDLENQLAL
jgi:hypothetical protein